MPYRKSIINILLLTILSVGSAFRCFSLDWNSNSVLSSGRWAKVKVTENGIQELSYDTLRELGFDSPEKVTVFGYGGAALYHNSFSISDHDDLPQVPAMHNNERLLFYGQSHIVAKFNRQSKIELQRNHYATAGYYFLTDSREPLLMEQLRYDSEASADTLLTHSSLTYINPMEYNPVKAGVFFFSENIASNPSAGTITIPTPGRADGTNATLNGTVVTNGIYPFTLRADNTSLTPPRLTGEGYFSTLLPLYTIPYSDGKAENINIEFTASAQGSFLAYDFLGVAYTRSNDMEDVAELAMTYNRTTARTRVVIPEYTPEQLEVWDITNPVAVKRYELVNAESADESVSGSVLYFSGRCSPSVPDSHKHLIAFRPDQPHHRPTAEPLAANQNLHSLDTPDMLIITTDECHDQANRLADLHRQYQGFDVQVVSHQDIFNEFSSGTPTAMAYRRMAKMFYDRDSEKFRYLLLMGASIYDNRLLLPEHAMYTPDKMLLCYQPDNVDFQLKDDTSSTSDSYFALLHDNSTGNIIDTREESGYHNMMISVGRIPAISNYQAKIYVDKAERYMREGVSAEARTRALLFADDGNADIHLVNSESVALQINASLPTTAVSRAHNGIYPWEKKVGLQARQKVMETLEKGVGFFYYSGHGRPDCFTSEGIWTKLLVNRTKISQYPLMFFSSCNAFSFDRQDDNICETTLFAENGGTVALISAAREVFNNENRQLAMLYLKYWGEAGPQDCYADIFRKMRNYNFYDRNYQGARGTTMAYNFGGDPALPLYPFVHSVELTEINGNDTSDGDVVLLPMQSNIFAGRVTDKEGNLQEDYNGTATIFVYESGRPVPNLYSDKAPASDRNVAEVMIEDDLLCMVKLPVVNGTIHGEAVIPAPSRPGQGARIIIAADVKDAPALNASGIIKDVRIEEPSPDAISSYTDDTEIVAIYLGDETYSDGSVVGPSTTFHAEIKGAGAASTVQATGINQSVKLVLDNKEKIDRLQTFMHTDVDGVITIDLPMEGLSEGTHTLTLTVTGLSGNIISESLNFQVVNDETEIILLSDKAIVTDEVTFSVEHNFPADYTARLIIEDISGKHILSRNNVSFPYVLDTVTTDLPDGSYTVRVMADDGKRFCGSSPLQITIIH